MSGWWINVLDLFTVAWVPLLFSIVGTALGHVLFYVSLGANARKNKDRMLEKAAQRDSYIRELKAELWDAYKRGLADMNELNELRRMVSEKRNYDRAWAMRAKAVLNKHIP